MRILLKFAANLYSAWWRARYGPEFAALLEDAPPRWTDVLDLFKGALKMQIIRPTIIATCAVAGVLLVFAASVTMTTRYASTATFPSPEAIPTKVIDDALRNVRHKITSIRGRTGSPSVVQVTFFPRNSAASSQTVHDMSSALKANSVPISSIFSSRVDTVGPTPLWFSAWGFAAGLLLGLTASWIVNRVTRPAI